jgi:hypothetical protein
MPIIVSGDAAFFADKKWQLKDIEFIKKAGGKFCQFLSINRIKFCLCGITLKFESPGDWAFTRPKMQKCMV